jgi:cytochrome P450
MGFQPAQNDAVRDKANAVMYRIGSGLLKQIRASQTDKSARRKDILSLLTRANAMETKAHQITDEEIMSRAYKPALNRCILLNMLSEIPTFLIAGHETTRCMRLIFRVFCGFNF